ncbi:hypothetical protein FIM08_03495 [SAR202 cluster bacterium AC-647-N09_OGT_505m]|nr:hypothetical protein [SAR202 cluster bacterium AC-647-N09_OGT_505m]
MTTSEEDPKPENRPLPPHKAALLEIQRRGSYFIPALLWMAAVGGIAVLGGYFFIVLNVTLDTAERVRQSIGFDVPAAGPDWYILSIISIVASVPVGFIAVLGLWYWRIWQRRLRKVWRSGADIRRHAPIRTLTKGADAKELNTRIRYLKTLLDSPDWRDSGLTTNGNALDVNAIRTEDDYRRLAKRVFETIEKDVAERAIATGLIVSLGPSKLLDRATIIISALEMQLHVLSLLGKKPSLRTWHEMKKRTSASIFFNTFLNMEDMFAVSLTIRSTAITLEASAAMLEGGITEGVGNIQGVGPLLQGAIGAGGSVLDAIASLIKDAGDELSQGALAGGVLYFHGMTIAADILSLDTPHRQSPEMTRTPLEGARRTAVVAGSLLKNQVMAYREAYRKQTRASIQGVGNRIRSFIPGLSGSPKPISEENTTDQTTEDPSQSA